MIEVDGRFPGPHCTGCEMTSVPDCREAGKRPWRAAPLLAGLWLAAGVILPAVNLVASPAWALSEIKQGDTPEAPAGGESIDKAPLPPVEGVPLPDPIEVTPPADATPGVEEPEDEASPPDEGEGNVVGRPEIDPDAPLPEVEYDVSRLPEPVRRMRDLIIEATKTGDIDKLRPLIGTGDSATQLSLGGTDSDPIDFLKELSGDPEGQEILAILQEVITAGYIHLDAGKPNELYVWPYFFGVPLDKLTPPQRVELFKIVTAGDYEDMKAYGAYIFYRVGIMPDGHWSFFVAGD